MLTRAGHVIQMHLLDNSYNITTGQKHCLNGPEASVLLYSPLLWTEFIGRICFGDFQLSQLMNLLIKYLGYIGHILFLFGSCWRCMLQKIKQLSILKLDFVCKLLL